MDNCNHKLTKEEYEAKFGEIPKIDTYGPSGVSVNPQYEVKIDGKSALWISADCKWSARAYYMRKLIERAAA